ncbi:cupin domain-containing protein, partial [Serratia marcescens]
MVGELAWQGAQPGSQALFAASVPARQRAELWEWTLMPGERYDSAPDAEGWSEMIYVIAGTLTLELEQDTLTLAAGAAQTFNSDQRYAYANHGDLPLRFIRNVAF